LRGDQVTVDGFVENGRATIMGVVDSVMYPGTMSFRRFDLPSRLPDRVQARMAELAARLMEGSGFDQSCYNIEMFHDPQTDDIHIIEVNPRMSYQFGDLYEFTHGINTYAVQLDLARRRPVRWQSTPSGVAASFVMRRFQDGIVEAVPSAGEIAAVQQRFPGTTVKVLCHVGQRLSSQDQDMQSYRYGIVNMGGPSWDVLLARYAEVERLLTFRFRNR